MDFGWKVVEHYLKVEPKNFSVHFYSFIYRFLRKTSEIFMCYWDCSFTLTVMFSIWLNHSKENGCTLIPMCFICYCFCCFSLLIYLFFHSTRLEFYVKVWIYIRFGVLVSPNLVFALLEDRYNWRWATMVVGRKRFLWMIVSFLLSVRAFFLATISESDSARDLKTSRVLTLQHLSIVICDPLLKNNENWSRDLSFSKTKPIFLERSKIIQNRAFTTYALSEDFRQKIFHGFLEFFTSWL